MILSLSSRLVNIPVSLRQLGRVWLAVNDAKKFRDSVNEPCYWSDEKNLSDWYTMACACHFAHSCRWVALAVVLKYGLELTYVDLDNVRNPVTGEITREAQKIVDALGTYTEVSQSLTGLHMVVWSSGRSRNWSAWLREPTEQSPSGIPSFELHKLPEIKEDHWPSIIKRPRIEVYSTSHIATFTGMQLAGSSNEVEDHFNRWHDMDGLCGLREVTDQYRASRTTGTPHTGTTKENGPYYEGERGNTLFRLGMRLLESGEAEGEDGLYEALAKINESECEPPLPDRDVATTSASCCSRYERRLAAGEYAMNKDFFFAKTEEAMFEAIRKDPNYGDGTVVTFGTRDGSRGAKIIPIRPAAEGARTNCHLHEGEPDPTCEVCANGTAEIIRNSRRFQKLVSKRVAFSDWVGAIRAKFRHDSICRHGHRPYVECGITVYGKVAGGSKVVGSRKHCADFHCLRCGPLRKAVWLMDLLERSDSGELWHQRLYPEEFNKLKNSGRQRLKRLHGKYRAFCTNDGEDMVEVLSTSPFTTKATNQAEKVELVNREKVIFGVLERVRLPYFKKEKLVFGSHDWACPVIGSAKGEDYEYMGEGPSPDKACALLKMAGFNCMKEHPDEAKKRPNEARASPTDTVHRWYWGLQIPVKTSMQLDFIKNVLGLRDRRRRRVETGVPERYNSG